MVATRRLLTVLGTLLLVSLTLSGCLTVVRRETTVIEDAGWHRDKSSGGAQVVLPSATITVTPTGISKDPDLALRVRITQQQTGLTFRPFDLRLDGRAPDQVYIRTGFFSRPRLVEPGEEVALSDSEPFNCYFKNIVVLPKEAATTEKKVTLSIEGLKENGRTIVVPPLTIDVKWVTSKEFLGGGGGDPFTTMRIPRFEMKGGWR